MELLKLLSTNEIVAQVLSFLLLLFLLRMFAWKRILKLLDERKERIASEFKGIDEAKKEIEKTKTDYEQRLAKIEETAQARLLEAAQAANEIRDEIRRKAHQDAQAIIDHAKENIKYELAKAKEELKEQIIDLSLKAAETVIQERLTEADDKRIVKDFLERIDEIE